MLRGEGAEESFQGRADSLSKSTNLGSALRVWGMASLQWLRITNVWLLLKKSQDFFKSIFSSNKLSSETMSFIQNAKTSLILFLSSVVMLKQWTL